MCTQGYLLSVFLNEARKLYAEEHIQAAVRLCYCGGCAITACCCYQDWLVGLGVGIIDHCLKEILTVHFLSRPSKEEFLSTNSFICSFRTSTSSLTAYIKWLSPDPVKTKLGMSKKGERGRSCYLVLLINTRRLCCAL